MIFTTNLVSIGALKHFAFDVLFKRLFELVLIANFKGDACESLLALR